MAIDVITLSGGLVADPEIRITPSGAAVAEFRIAQSDHKLNQQTKQWDKTRSLYLSCTLWDENPQYKQNPIPWAQIAANQLAKGMRVAVRGKLHTEQWDDRDGNKRSQIKFLAESFFVMPDTRGQSQPPAQQQGTSWNSQQQPQGGFSNQAQQQNNDPWNSTPPAGNGGFGDADDNPPF